MQHPNLFLCPIERLQPYANNARTHSSRQIRLIADSIKRFGFTNPVLIAEDHTIMAGHGRVEAAKVLGILQIPTIKLAHLSNDERRAYILADNKIAEQAGWDNDILAIELQSLIDIDFDLDLTGFSTTEIDLIFDQNMNDVTETDPVLDDIPAPSTDPAITRKGDLWQLGDHLLLCGDARLKENIVKLCGPSRIDLIITDPPYNVAIQGHVSGLGSIKHREFLTASGEMNKPQFTAFLTATLSNAGNVAKEGAIAYVFMDWRHMEELLIAGTAAFSELKNLCVWNKTNGGMGTFYRSKHELVFVFKKGNKPHTNNFGLGDTGRYRTNVWDYAGISSISATRDEELAMHPTVKPIRMIMDAIKDCSKHGESVLDIFAGSGTTLIAAEECGRKSRLLELDPVYCDTIIRRFEKITGQPAYLDTGMSFDEVADIRLSPLSRADTADIQAMNSGAGKE